MLALSGRVPAVRSTLKRHGVFGPEQRRHEAANLRSDADSVAVARLPCYGRGGYALRRLENRRTA